MHADVVHVAGNALATAVLLPPIVQQLGAGVALLLVLLTGAAGNVLAALAHDPRHVAVGASTATFGALGVLVAQRLVSRERARRGKRWMAPVAGVVLLAMLGAAPGSDLTAHAFGFVAGLALGALASLTVRRPRPPAQWVVGALAGLALSACWYLAMR